MSETFECRQTMIETDLKSVTLVLEKFPHFTDFEHGFLVSKLHLIMWIKVTSFYILIINKFLTKYPSSGAFEDNFLFKLSSKIREVAIIEKITVPVKCSDGIINWLRVYSYKSILFSIDCLTSLMPCLLKFPAIRRIKRESQTGLFISQKISISDCNSDNGVFFYCRLSNDEVSKKYLCDNRQ
jgi:hypothetical protein